MKQETRKKNKKNKHAHTHTHTHIHIHTHTHTHTHKQTNKTTTRTTNKKQNKQNEENAPPFRTHFLLFNMHGINPSQSGAFSDRSVVSNQHQHGKILNFYERPRTVVSCAKCMLGARAVGAARIRHALHGKTDGDFDWRRTCSCETSSFSTLSSNTPVCTLNLLRASKILFQIPCSGDVIVGEIQTAALNDGKDRNVVLCRRPD